MKTCPCPCGCKVTANTLEENEKFFGYRGKIIQSYCKKCRGPHKGIQIPENINPIFNVILHGTQYDYHQTKNFYSQIPKFDENGKFITHTMRYTLTKAYLLNKNKKFVDDFLRLLEEPEPLIEEKQFVDLFEMYNFKITLPEQYSFFNFKINTNTECYVILKIYQKITNQSIKILDTQLGESNAIILTLANDNPLDFSYNNSKICILDRDLIECLLLYRINEIKMDYIHNLFSNGGKL